MKSRNRFSLFRYWTTLANGLIQNIICDHPSPFCLYNIGNTYSNRHLRVSSRWREYCKREVFVGIQEIFVKLSLSKLSWARISIECAYSFDYFKDTWTNMILSKLQIGRNLGKYHEERMQTWKSAWCVSVSVKTITKISCALII